MARCEVGHPASSVQQPAALRAKQVYAKQRRIWTAGVCPTVYSRTFWRGGGPSSAQMRLQALQHGPRSDGSPSASFGEPWRGVGEECRRHKKLTHRGGAPALQHGAWALRGSYSGRGGAAMRGFEVQSAPLRHGELTEACGCVQTLTLLRPPPGVLRQNSPRRSSQAEGDSREEPGQL